MANSDGVSSGGSHTARNVAIGVGVAAATIGSALAFHQLNPAEAERILELFARYGDDAARLGRSAAESVPTPLAEIAHDVGAYQASKHGKRAALEAATVAIKGSRSGDESTDAAVVTAT